MDQEEKIIMDIKKHWVYLIPSGIVMVFSIIIAMFLVEGREVLVQENILRTEHLYILVSTIIFIGIFFASQGFIQWQFSFYQITNKRIRSIEVCRGYEVRIKEALFDLVKSIEEDKPGILSSIFKYAHIKINTDSMSSDSLLKIRYIHHPEMVFQKLEELVIANNQ